MKTILWSGVLALLALPLPASASLGGDTASVKNDVAKMETTVRTTSGQGYEVHEMKSQAGVAIKEFASPAGTIFAVSWSGPTHPDLRQLLGAYYDQYVQAVQEQRAHRRGRGPLLIHEPGLVMKVSGHLRAFQGKAYLPQLVPAGVRVEDLP
ncbi:MAG TPA: DUF2844 domain-containing protein [Candidatus Acidoferrum sp.]|nr:DUF2844 domain-containing protein [Candidatus Acidoferrum sp.]